MIPGSEVHGRLFAQVSAVRACDDMKHSVKFISLYLTSFLNKRMIDAN